MTTATHYDLYEIQRLMDNSGSHWFDDDTMHFFKTRLGTCHSGRGGVFFTTSEKPPYGPRQHSVRQFHPDELRIETVGEFCSMTSAQANKMSRELSEDGTEGGDSDE